MKYNLGFKCSGFIKGPTQEQIYECPEYFAMSKDEIINHETCPQFLKEILAQYPWDGRKNVVQVKPQDFSTGVPKALGRHWHTDLSVLLDDGVRRVADNEDDFHLMVASWGGVVGTDFMTTPLDGGSPFYSDDNFGPGHIMLMANEAAQEWYTSKDGELIEYTSQDIHRMGIAPKIGRLRLLVVAFDCNNVPASGKVLPSIKERDDE